VLLIGTSDLDIPGQGSKGSELLLYAVNNARQPGGAARELNMAVELWTGVNVALHDGVVDDLVDTSRLDVNERGLEESLRRSETFAVDGDDLTVRQLVGLLNARGRGSGLHLLLIVKSDIAEVLLDATHDLPLRSGGEGVATPRERMSMSVQSHHGQIEMKDGMGQTIALEGGHSVGHTITRAEGNAGGAA